jgi:hypothetical protein
MGSWNISIKGVGPHHNNDHPTDADRMARRFVRELNEAGHSIASAELVLTDGGTPLGAGTGLEDKAPDPKTS